MYTGGRSTSHRSVVVGSGPGSQGVSRSWIDRSCHEAVETAVRLVREGQGHILMKGKVTSGDLMKEVLHRERGLRTGRLLSDVFLFDSPSPGEPRLIGITDGGINLAPELEAKAQILSNALEVFRAMGYERPKVAVLSAIEQVNPDLPSTVDAAELARRGEAGAFGSCDVAGPLAMDLAVSAEAARRKGVEHSRGGRGRYSSLSRPSRRPTSRPRRSNSWRMSRSDMSWWGPRPRCSSPPGRKVSGPKPTEWLWGG